MANRLRELRLSRNIKQTELCKMLNVTQATLSNWERGVFDIDTKSLIRISGIFDVSVDYILGVSGVRNPEEAISFKGKKNTLKVFGYGGTQFERELTEEQMNEVMRYIDFMKSKEEDEES